MPLKSCFSHWKWIVPSMPRPPEVRILYKWQPEVRWQPEVDYDNHSMLCGSTGKLCTLCYSKLQMLLETKLVLFYYLSFPPLNCPGHNYNVALRSHFSLFRSLHLSTCNTLKWNSVHVFVLNKNLTSLKFTIYCRITYTSLCSWYPAFHNLAGMGVFYT